MAQTLVIFSIRPLTVTGVLYDLELLSYLIINTLKF